MNIVLIGYRGTGKSAVGAILAARLGMCCIALDAKIVAQAGKSIPEIVACDGWPAFRDMECAVARECCEAGDGLILDTGGGIIERPENVAVLRENGLVIWLKASVPVIVARIQGDTQRPALTSGKTFTEEVAEVLERRNPKYRDAAHAEIDTDPLTPEQVAERVIEIWKGDGRNKD